MIERFWSFVNKNGRNGCWEWKDAKDNGGYGVFRLANGNLIGHERRAHRFSAELRFGPIPKRMLVCHHCDNPSCVRPDHLFVGTSKDNAWDAARKGRLPTKLTTEQRARLKMRPWSLMPDWELARGLSVAPSTVASARSKKPWHRWMPPTLHTKETAFSTSTDHNSTQQPSDV